MMRVLLGVIALVVALALPGAPANAACSGNPGGHACYYTTAGANSSPFATEANACTTLTACLGVMAAGDVLYVVNTSNETLAVSTNFTFPGTAAAPNQVYNVATGGNTVTAGSAGAGSVTSSNGSSLSFFGVFSWDSAFISAGSGANSASISFGNNDGSSAVILNSKLVLGGSTGGVVRAVGTHYRMINTTVKFTAAGSAIQSNTNLIWQGGSYDASAVQPTSIISWATGGATFFVEGVDLSSITSGNLFASPGTNVGGIKAVFKDVKINSGASIAAAMTGPEGYPFDLTLIRMDSAANAARFERRNSLAVMTTVTSATTPPVLRTGGASDGVTPVSWNLLSTARASWWYPFVAEPISIFNTTTAANLALTIEGICSPRDCSALPNNDQIWFETEYLGASTSPLGSYCGINCATKANGLASGVALTASTAAWDSAAPARQNSHTYANGDVFAVADNAGRLFQVTAGGGGNSAGSEPAGYASAVDGGTVTDGALTVKAFWRFNQTITLSSPQPGMQGPITIYPKVGQASLTDGYWVDPMVTISGVTLGKTFAVGPGGYVNSLGAAATSRGIIGGQ